MDMRKEQSKLQRFRDLVRNVGVLHARDLTRMGIPQRYLGLLRDEGALVRLDRGVYVTNSDSDSPHFALAQVAKSVPGGVVCLLSALRFHEIGTQLPHQVWLALDRRAAKPRVSFPEIHFVRFSGAAMAEGIEEHIVSGVTVRIYCPDKTVVDCFKYAFRFRWKFCSWVLGNRSSEMDVNQDVGINQIAHYSFSLARISMIISATS